MYDAAAGALIEIRRPAVPGPDSNIRLATHSNVGYRSWQTVAYDVVRKILSIRSCYREQ
jgi:hypothetical protein